ncbi:MAG: hypothetical protein DRP22_00685 [Verrucomicrobia bacterium]|nr:MAG: hypothetical protein DRP22_00685 [Verrucomicrobiota bacterium]
MAQRRNEAIRSLIKQFTGRQAHPAIQFIKYGIGGAIATLVDVLVFYLCAWMIFPALRDDDFAVKLLSLPVRAVSESLRSRNFVIDSIIAFIFSNLTAYLINIVWVFTPGRHRRHVEIALFYAVSVTSIAIGTGVGWMLITMLGTSTTFSYIAKMVAAVMINYVCRKYVVFQG